MPLNNFGSILNFAEQIETQDYDFYTKAAQNKNCADLKQTFEQLATAEKKNQKEIQRIRREYVTEMILEGINDFTREPYLCDYADPLSLNADAALQTAKNLEQRAEKYYTDAAEKIKALSEVSRGLKQLAKKRKANIKKLGSV